eukprot:2357728-Prymnesium_polylepis.3
MTLLVLTVINNILKRFASYDTRPMLGRWCLPSSDAYPRCNQDRKSLLSTYDNGFETMRLSPNDSDASNTSKDFQMKQSENQSCSMQKEPK